MGFDCGFVETILQKVYNNRFCRKTFLSTLKIKTLPDTKFLMSEQLYKTKQLIQNINAPSIKLDHCVASRSPFH